MSLLGWRRRGIGVIMEGSFESGGVFRFKSRHGRGKDKGTIVVD